MKKQWIDSRKCLLTLRGIGFGLLLFGGLMTPGYSQTLTHRYDFKMPDDGMSVNDLVGSANGFLYGTGNFDGLGKLNLLGIDGYVDLGPDLISSSSSLTIEAWGRLVDFGDTDESGNGVHCMDCTPHSGFSPNGINWEVNGANGTESLNVAPVLDGQNVHLVLVFNPQAQYLAIYTNGVIMLGYYGSASSDAGKGYELDVIAAAVVGGASLSGGRGTALGALLGALIIQMINNGIIILNIDQNYSQIIIGFVIVVAVLLDRINSALREKRLSRAAQLVRENAKKSEMEPVS